MINKSTQRAYVALGVALATFATVALANTFNLFSPATGVLKGSASTYVTTAAVSADIRNLWTGTCNSTTFLRGDGSCQAAAGGSGTVTSVALTLPSGLSVGGSPVTTSGTLAVTTSLNGPLRGNGSGFTTGNLALGSEVSGTLPVANGGTGVATLTGLALGNGTSPFSAAASTNVLALWSGTCDSTTFLRGDGACVTPGGGGGGGTVTSVGLTVPSGLSVSGSPVVAAGTLAITTALNGPVRGNGSGFTTGATALGSEVSGTLPVANGGTGAATLTGPLKGNGTSAFSAAASADIVGLFSGTCNAGTSLRGDGSCLPSGAGTVTSVAISAPSIFTVSGSPVTTSGTLTLTANGTSGGIPYFSASNALSSSAALTANRLLLGGGAGAAPTILGSLGTTTTLLHGNAAGAPTFGAVILTTDVTGTLPVANGGTGTTTSTGTGSAVLSASPAFTGTPTISGQNICRADGTNCPAVTGTTGSFTASFTVACTTSLSRVFRYAIIGSVVTITAASTNTGTCTSDSASFSTASAVAPVAIRPSSGFVESPLIKAENNGVQVDATIIISSNGSMSYAICNNLNSSCSSTSWTASGTKAAGVNAGSSWSYVLN